MSDNQPQEATVTPKARLINRSLFEKDAYTAPGQEPGTPMYKAEIALDPDDPEFEDFEDAMFDYIENQGHDPDDVALPFIDGDDLAKDREARNKPGDAYRGKEVLRVNTIYNHEGEDAPGGVEVYDEDVKRVSIQHGDKLYRGCLVRVAVTFKIWKDPKTRQHRLKCYLKSVQKVGDGERLKSAADHSNLFEPAERKAGEGRRRRRRRD